MHTRQLGMTDMQIIVLGIGTGEMGQGWIKIANFKQEGKVRAIGVSNFDVSQMRRAQEIAAIDSLQPPYSLIKRDVEKEILGYCQEQQIGVIVYSPMMSGLLTGM